MNHTYERRNGELRKVICHALLILPAIALGALAMIHGGVSPALWGQQIAAWVIFALLIWLLQRACRRIPAQAWCVLLVIVLAAAQGAGLIWACLTFMRRSWCCLRCLWRCAA